MSNMVKILLVNPKPLEAYTVYGPSLGLCYLSSYLKMHGFSDIEGIDLNIDGDDALDAAIRRADVVGIYCSTKALRPALRAAREAKDAGKIVVLGGPHPSVLPEEVLRREEVDFVILSEGEASFLQLVQALGTGSDYTGIDGFGYKDSSGRLVINPRTKYIEDLDIIPFPDRNLFRFDQSRMITFCATRGCPYKCANCQPALSLQTCAFRMRSVDNVITELKQIAPGKIVHFIDNDLTVNKKWIRALCTKIIEEGLKFTWGCQGRVNTLDREIMSLMKRAGCVNIGVGIESGSQQLLDNFLHKQLSLEKARKVVAESLEAKMPLHGWFIIGIPSETREDMEKTIQFALSQPFATVGFSIGTPWPGTMFHAVSSEKGWIVADSWEDFNEKRFSRLKTPEWGPDDIATARERIIAEFRKKKWIVDAEDFVFIDPAWGKVGLAAYLARTRARIAQVRRRMMKRFFGRLEL